MLFRIAAVFVICVVLLVCSGYGQQPATGFPSFGSFAGGPDAINLSNLNVHLDVPITAKKGRGVNFSYKLSYDNSVWSLDGTFWLLNWSWQGIGTGLNIGQAWVGLALTASSGQTCVGGGSGSSITYSGYMDGLGTTHPLANNVTADTCGHGGSSVTSDNSGYTLSAPGGNLDNVTVTAADGTVLSPANSSNPVTITDPNGNQVSLMAPSSLIPLTPRPFQYPGHFQVHKRSVSPIRKVDPQA